MVITVEQAKAQLDALIDRSNAGEEVFIARGGRLVARMVAVGPGEGSHGNGVGNGVGEACEEPGGIAPLPPAPSSTQARRLGSAKGRIHIADDFDAPMDEFREYME